MKELSIEEKAKAYDKAKYIMKEYLESGNAGVIAENTIKKAFPELAESEDERIRKHLIGVVELYYGNTDEQEKKDCLNWLEKQNLVIEMKTPEESLGIDSGTYSKIVDECIYGEQKPADWSADDLPEFESYLCFMFQKFRTKGVCTNGEIVDFVKEHSQKLKDTLCHAWSEEDEKEMATIEHHLNNCGASITSILWFKSLKERYAWEPSDTQMASITCAVRKMKESACYDSELVSLYQDLKKL